MISGRRIKAVTMQDKVDIAIGTWICSKMYLVRIIFDMAIITRIVKEMIAKDDIDMSLLFSFCL